MLSLHKLTAEVMTVNDLVCKSFTMQTVSSLLHIVALVACYRPIDICVYLKPLDLKPLDFKPLDLKPFERKPLDLKSLNLKPLDLKPLDLLE